jgi:hypothetical protein
LRATNPSSGFTTLQAKQSKTKQKKDWGEINLLAQNPKPKP